MFPSALPSPIGPSRAAGGQAAVPVSPPARPSAGQAEVAILGDHGFLIHAIAVLLADEGDFAVRELERPIDDAGRALRRAGSRVALVSLTQMGPTESVDEVRTLAQAAPATELVAILRLPDPVLARDVLRAGARSCITSRASTGELFDAIYRALDGESYLNPELALTMANFADVNGPADLNLREKEVLRQIGLGLTNREIGIVMHLSERTIESHRANLQRKLGTMRRADLVRHAASLGLIG
jgi:two-component system response regulator NreC